MENIIQMLAPLIIVLLISILSNARRRKAQQNAERRTDEQAMSESEDTPPPFMEDFPFETQLEQMILQQDEREETLPVVEEPARPESESSEPVVETSQPQPPPVPVESPTGRRSVPATSLLNLSPQTFRQGIILSEILGRPKSHSRRQSAISRR